MKSTTYGALAVAVVVVLALAFVFSQPLGSSPGTTPSGGLTSSSGPASSTGSAQAENRTVVATFVSTMESAPETTSTSMAGTTTSYTSTSATTTLSAASTTTQPLVSGGAYSYTASSQVKILSVAAVVSGSQAGDPAVSFTVQFQNIGSGDIYVLAGGGSGLNATITSGGSIVSQVSSPRCEIAVAIVPLSPGSESTAMTPGCWSGYSLQLLQPGSIQVHLTLSWSGSETGGPGGGSVDIYGQFTLQ